MSPSQIQARLKASADAAVWLKGRIGEKVHYWGDDRDISLVTIDSEPWMLAHGGWVIKILGRSGGFDCARFSV